MYSLLYRPRNKHIYTTLPYRDTAWAPTTIIHGHSNKQTDTYTQICRHRAQPDHNHQRAAGALLGYLGNTLVQTGASTRSPTDNSWQNQN